MPSQTITRIDVWPVDIPITDPFVVATGSRLTAENVYVRVRLASGACGVGEIAPFPEVGGEDRPRALISARRLAEAAVGQSAGEYRVLAARFHELAPDDPAARCGLETAIVDALCRDLRIPLWALFGAADVRPRETDMTIPICDLERTVTLARSWHARGFRLLKMKVGRLGSDVEDDIRRVQAVHRVLPDVQFIADANQGFTVETCARFTQAVQRGGGTIVLLEQPVPKDDVDGLAALRKLTGLPVAADESVRTVDDARKVFTRQAADMINIKIMKSGLIAAMDIAAYARTAGLRLMIGGMVESRVAMGCSFSLVLGCGGYEVLDLDTPLLLSDDPIQGGYRYDGPMLQPWQQPGLDMELAPGRDVISIG